VHLHFKTLLAAVEQNLKPVCSRQGEALLSVLENKNMTCFTNPAAAAFASRAEHSRGTHACFSSRANCGNARMKERTQ
jgi:hypothetical protein